ncbi:MAG TPA: hypothetical protein DEB06_00510 [Phycisphaerales bacterium]|nr:hypothetical protein [Phycisphaerales bacterium]
MHRVHAVSIASACVAPALLLGAGVWAQDAAPGFEPATTGPSPAPAPAADVAPAAPPPELGLLERERLLGNWWGARTKLAESGIRFEIDWTQTIQGVVGGGREREWEYGGSLDYLLNIDLGKAGLVPGGFLRARGESRYGDSVNGISGAVLPVDTRGFFPLTSPIDDEIPIALTELTYTQFFAPWVGVFAGKLQTLDGDPNEFASGRGARQFMNSHFIFESVTALTVPYSTLGGGVVLLPSENITILSTVMNSTDSSTTSGFDDFGDGWTWTTELRAQYTLGTLPGGMNLGVIYAADGAFQTIGGRLGLLPFVARDTEDSTWAVYWSGWQYLVTLDEPTGPIRVDDGVPDLRGLGLFARAGFADDDTNPVEVSVSGGLGGRGLVPTRGRDTFGVGVFYTRLQELRGFQLGGIDRDSVGGEGYYTLAITPAMDLTLNLQVLSTAFDGLDTATILGFRLNMRF